ncbi:LysR family transcriptional regulator [Anaerosacchariphilus polymeriproducens]|uniref:LysR family transcriptional regulator n=1 Tax=Anaerosacchariphilus polymeriproducens TaxID=1812858 RepID=A0A371AV22_9FIRM|nr:LysR family transcriptional regulator [Anaerosacchariphilus polymeriproducens]RDU23418.1 LysR family transcriptional regulator [Anaerosacchariphilus polymeriproducens]
MNKTKNLNRDVFVRVDTLMNELKISKALAYRLMKEMNDELRSQGYLTISGRVPKAYYHARFFGMGVEKS